MAPRIDPVAAQAEAQHVLAAAGATGTISVHANVVTVRATVPALTVILSAIGIHDASGTAAAATILHGTTTPVGVP